MRGIQLVLITDILSRHCNRLSAQAGALMPVPHAAETAAYRTSTHVWAANYSGIAGVKKMVQLLSQTSKGHFYK